MIEVNCPNFAERHCLFPGGYCFPLSPKRNQKLDEDGIPIDNKNDQLEHIFALIGTPNETDTSFVTDEKARLYLNQFAAKSPGFEKRFPSCEPSGLKLLAEMLQFNPFFRPTIEECLQSPYFEKVSQFSAVQHAPSKVDFAFEHAKYTSFGELRKLIVKEIGYY